MHTVITIKTDGTSELQEFLTFVEAFNVCAKQPHESHFMIMPSSYGYAIGVFENDMHKVQTNWPNAEGHALHNVAKTLFLISGLNCHS